MATPSSLTLFKGEEEGLLQQQARPNFNFNFNLNQRKLLSRRWRKGGPLQAATTRVP
jgi:hypothetical protein